jgi:hypothetical protein
MSLPSKYRFQVENDGLGTDCDVEIKTRGIDRTQSPITYDGSWSSDLGTADLASGSFYATGEQDNTTDGFTDVELEVTLSAFGGTPNDDGNVMVRIQGEGDGASDWPDDGNGAEVLIFDPDATGSYTKTTIV